MHVLMVEKMDVMADKGKEDKVIVVNAAAGSC